MPKIGRLTGNEKNNSTNTNYLFGSAAVTRNAPFGNIDTPKLRIKIIGGKKIPVAEKQPPPNHEDGEAYEMASAALNPAPASPVIHPHQETINEDTEMLNLSQRERNNDYELSNCLREELVEFKVGKLKDIYLELTGFDHNMTGYVNQDDLGYALIRAQMPITPRSLRFLTAKFVSPKDKEKVNYEKLLSFIGEVLNRSNSTETKTHDHMHKLNQSGKNTGQYKCITSKGQYFNPITHNEEDYSSGSTRFPYQDRNNAKLLRYIEQQLVESETDLDFEKIWSVFMESDRAHRGKLSRRQIKDLTVHCRIPLQDSLVDQIINRCDGSNGQFDWQQYLEFIERVKPVHTGLNIPESKKPTEFARHVPTPSTNWPKEIKDTRRGSPEVNSDQNKNSSDPIDEQKFEVEIARQEPIKAASLKNDTRNIPTSEPWFERFMKLADELYTVDDQATGYLPEEEVKWLVKKSNLLHHLHLSDEDIHTSISSCEEEGSVPIDQVLRRLSLKGP